MESTSTAAWAGPYEHELAKDHTQFVDDAYLNKKKMHRYPPSLQAVGDSYTVPKVVAIGPYYHHRDQLQKAEKMKRVAAHLCLQEYRGFNNNSGLSIRDLYDAVVSVAMKLDARSLYDKDEAAGIGNEDDFLPMMFFDACFLVMYILKRSGAENIDAALYDFLESNEDDIAHDIMLLENQIPLQVVDAVMNMCTAKPMERMEMFIAVYKVGFLQDRALLVMPRVDWDQDYYNEAPHLLGLFRFYAVGKRRESIKPKVPVFDLKKLESMPFSAGAVELAEMGIFLSLTANQTLELSDMDLARKWIIFSRLSVPPLFLNYARASWLVNMAALELCTTPDFFDDMAELKDSAVCSYLRLLYMLMDREEDVQELRTKGILRGGGGLNNRQTFDFFTSLQSLPKGRSYAAVMAQISTYRIKRRYIIAVYVFLCKNWKYIVAIVSSIGGFIGIITTLMKLKGAH